MHSKNIKRSEIKIYSFEFRCLFRYRRGTGKKEKNYCVFGINAAMLQAGLIAVNNNVDVIDL